MKDYKITKEEMKKITQKTQEPIVMTMPRKRKAETNQDEHDNTEIKVKIDLEQARVVKIDWTTEKGREKVEGNWFSLDLN